MASQAAPRVSWQVPNRNLVHSLTVFGLRFVQRGYRSLCHHFIFPLANDVTRRRKVLKNGMVIFGTVLLLLLISLSHSENLTTSVAHFTVQKSVGRQEVKNNKLCLHYFREFPFTLSSPEVEVGIVFNGTIVYRFCSVFRTLFGRATFADVARKRRELEKKWTRTNSGEGVLKSFSLRVTRGSNNSAKTYHHSIETEMDSIQIGSTYNDRNQPKQKQKVPTDDFITRASRKRVFDDVIVTSRSWEPIAEDDGNLFVYSAFYDDRPSRMKQDTSRKVRVLGMSVLNGLRDFPHLRKQVFCHYRWRSSPHLYISQRGRILSIMEDHNTT